MNERHCFGGLAVSGEVGETKPIGEKFEVRSLKYEVQNEANSPVPTIRKGGQAGRLCKTKPIPGGAGWAGTQGMAGVGAVQTKPIRLRVMCKASIVWRKSYDELDL
jgi:hypothetical protein